MLNDLVSEPFAREHLACLCQLYLRCLIQDPNAGSGVRSIRLPDVVHLQLHDPLHSRHNTVIVRLRRSCLVVATGKSVFELMPLRLTFARCLPPMQYCRFDSLAVHSGVYKVSDVSYHISPTVNPSFGFNTAAAGHVRYPNSF